MSASNSNINPVNITLTPVRVTWGGTDLGGTEGGVDVSIKYKMADVMVDQFGSTPLTSKVAGQEFTVKFILAETADHTKWKVAFPPSKLVGTSPNQINYFDMQIGDDQLARSQQLLLHPLDKVDADLSQDILMYKAVPISASEVKYGPDKQVGLSVEFKIYPDTSVIPAKMILHGDPSIGVVHAMVAGAVPGGGNVGNAAISSEVAYDQFTKTEVITVSVIGSAASSANVIEVSGSVTGIMGVFTLAAASASVHNFVVPQVSFIITQGSVQLALGDSYTIAATASNFS